MKIVFMGTAEFAVESLKKIHEDPTHEVIAAVTAADKIGGRGMKQWIASPVKAYALEQGLPLLQPSNLKDEAFISSLKELNAEAYVVVAFRMLPEVVWSIPTKGTINLHSSLLPKYRGAAPINWAIIQGEQESGVSTFLINHSIDTGNILLQANTPILPEDNAGSLHDKLMILGADLLLETLAGLEDGTLKPLPQDESKVSHAPKIFKETCKINFDLPKEKVHNFIRGLSPYPGAWMNWKDLEFKIFETQTLEGSISKFPPGTIFQAGKNDLRVQCIDGELRILQAQMQGKKRMNASEIINGHKHLLQSV